MTQSSRILVASALSAYPGSRYKKDGPGSGEALRDLIAQEHNAHEIVVVDLTGVCGCPSSFLEEATGGLVRSASAYGIDPNSLARRIQLIANDIPSNADEGRAYLAEALKGLAASEANDDVADPA